MSLTVVTTRDYDDVPTCSEKYELGSRWRVNGGSLEVFVGTTLVALYPSGNWVSVYADDAMQLHKGSEMPDYSAMPRVAVPPTRRSAVEDPLGPVRGIQPNRPVVDPYDDPQRRDRSVVTPVEDPLHDDSVVAADQHIIPDEDVAAARAAMLPVSFRPRRYRAAPPPATKAPTGPRMLPVRLRMRPYRAARDAEPVTAADPAAPRMMPVTMRTTIYRAARHLRPEIEAPKQDGAPDNSTDSDD